MNDEEQVPQARAPAAPTDAGETPVEKLEALGVRGILWQLARDGQIIDVRCEMPQCYCFRGRRYFEPRSPRSDWSPTADHYPRLKMHGGHLTPDNVRLAHRPFALVVAPLLGLGLLWRIALTVSTHGRPIDAVVHTRQSHLLGPGGARRFVRRLPSR